jgi:hypothetical protein
VHLKQQRFHLLNVFVSLVQLNLQRRNLLLVLILHQNHRCVVFMQKFLLLLDLVFP